jgi:hypothetical protein
MEHGAQPLRAFGFTGLGEGGPRGFDALFRPADPLAMVASGTMKAWAIWVVVKPPTARKVSAMAEGGLNV